MSRLSHTEKYQGLYTNSRGEKKPAYIQWKAGRGYLVYSLAGKPLVTEGFENLIRMKQAGVSFTLAPRSKKENTPTPPAAVQPQEPAAV